MSTGYLLTGIAVMAAITYLVRVLPMAIFRKRIRSRFVQSFLYYVPYAVLSAMTRFQTRAKISFFSASWLGRVSDIRPSMAIPPFPFPHSMPLAAVVSAGIVSRGSFSCRGTEVS